MSTTAASQIIGIPVSHATPTECVCPTCRTFERESGAELCPRCTVRAAVRSVKSDDKRRHFEAVSREVLALRLDKLDPDWPQKFLTTDAAANFYRAEIAAMEAA